jgi:hypothetical protein
VAPVVTTAADAAARGVTIAADAAAPVVLGASALPVRETSKRRAIR